MAATDPPLRNPVLPTAQTAMLDGRGAPIAAWFDFFRDLRTRVNDDAELQAEIDAILVRLETIENGSILGLNSVITFGSLSDGLVTVMLRGDVPTPDPLFYYGTGPDGSRGFWPAAQLVAYLVDEDGNYLVDEDGNYLIAQDITADLFAIVDTSFPGILRHTGAGTWDTLAPGTTAQFLRGDNAWTNYLIGPVIFQAPIDTATFGAELVTNGTFTGSAAGWTLGAGWAYAANAVTFTVGGTTTLSQNINVTSGRAYRVTWSQNHSIANNATITPSIGATNGSAVSYNATGALTQTQIIIAAATGAVALTFTPSTLDGGGTIVVDTVSVVEVTPIDPALTLNNAAGTLTAEARALVSNGNTAYGRDAGRSMSGGTACTFFGAIAGRNNTTAVSNSFFGNNAGGRTSTGGSNTAVGASAMGVNTSGANNAAFGVNAGMNNATGADNLFVGTAAGRSNISGGFNLFIGRNAAQFQADGVTALTSPDAGIYIGNDCRGFNNSDNNSIVIGGSAIGAGANTAVWGNTSMTQHYFSGSINLNQTNLGDLGAGVFRLLNATTNPSVNPTGGVVIYADAGAAKVRGSGGTVTTFGPADPHCPICESDYVSEFDNPKYGYLATCHNCAANGINSHTRVRGAWKTHKD